MKVKLKKIDVCEARRVQNKQEIYLLHNILLRHNFLRTLYMLYFYSNSHQLYMLPWNFQSFMLETYWIISWFLAIQIHMP